jgi:hypothetical protein
LVGHQIISAAAAAYMKEQEDKEAWKPVNFFHPESEESKSMLENLISTSVRA